MGPILSSTIPSSDSISTESSSSPLTEAQARHDYLRDVGSEVVSWLALVGERACYFRTWGEAVRVGGEGYVPSPSSEAVTHEVIESGGSFRVVVCPRSWEIHARDKEDGEVNSYYVGRREEAEAWEGLARSFVSSYNWEVTVHPSQAEVSHQLMWDEGGVRYRSGEGLVPGDGASKGRIEVSGKMEGVLSMREPRGWGRCGAREVYATREEAEAGGNEAFPTQEEPTHSPVVAPPEVASPPIYLEVLPAHPTPSFEKGWGFDASGLKYRYRTKGEAEYWAGHLRSMTSFPTPTEVVLTFLGVGEGYDALHWVEDGVLCTSGVGVMPGDGAEVTGGRGGTPTTVESWEVSWQVVRGATTYSARFRTREEADVFAGSKNRPFGPYKVRGTALEATDCLQWYVGGQKVNSTSVGLPSMGSETYRTGLPILSYRVTLTEGARYVGTVAEKELILKVFPDAVIESSTTMKPDSELVWTEGDVTYGSGDGILLPAKWALGADEGLRETIGLVPLSGDKFGVKRKFRVHSWKVTGIGPYLVKTLAEAQWLRANSKRCLTVMVEVQIEASAERPTSEIVWTSGGVTYGSSEGLLPSFSVGAVTMGVMGAEEWKRDFEVLSWDVGDGYRFGTKEEAHRYSKGAEVPSREKATHTFTWFEDGVRYNSSEGLLPEVGRCPLVVPLLGAQGLTFRPTSWELGGERYKTKWEADYFKAPVTGSREEATHSLTWEYAGVTYGSGSGLKPPHAGVMATSVEGLNVGVQSLSSGVYPASYSVFGLRFATEAEAIHLRAMYPKMFGTVEYVVGEPLHCLIWREGVAQFSSLEGRVPKDLAGSVVLRAEVPPEAISDVNWEHRSWEMNQEYYFTTKEEAVLALHGTVGEVKPSSSEPSVELGWTVWDEDKEGGVTNYGSSKGRRPSGGFVVQSITAPRVIRDGASWGVSSLCLFATKEEADLYAFGREVVSSGRKANAALTWFLDGKRYISGSGLLPPGTADWSMTCQSHHGAIRLSGVTSYGKVVVDGDRVQMDGAAFRLDEPSLCSFKRLVAYEEGTVEGDLGDPVSMSFEVSKRCGVSGVTSNGFHYCLPAHPSFLGEAPSEGNAGVGSFLGLLGGLGLMAGMMGTRKEVKALPRVSVAASEEEEGDLLISATARDTLKS